MKQTATIKTKVYHSPAGDLLLGSFEEKLCLCDWLLEPRHSRICQRIGRQLRAEFREGSSTVLEQTAKQLDDYFARQRQRFDLPLLLVGTPFQQQVWRALQQINYGQTVSYQEEANWIGRPQAVRAVANANGANPLSIIVPCHRVIGSNHTLTGYGGGLPAKQSLLLLEGVPLLRRRLFAKESSAAQELFGSELEFSAE